MKRMKHGTIVLAAAVLFASSTSIADVQPPAALDLELLDPDIFSSFISVDYDSGTGQFSAEGFAMVLKLAEDQTYTILNHYQDYSFRLYANIGTDGLFSGGDLWIGGTVPGLADTEPLLTVNLSSFGYQSQGGGIFEFLGYATGGSLAYLFAGAPVGTILDANDSDFTGTFTSFSNTGFGVADTASVVFEPATLMLVFMGLTGMVSVQLRSRLAKNRQV